MTTKLLLTASAPLGFMSDSSRPFRFGQ